MPTRSQEFSQLSVSSPALLSPVLPASGYAAHLPRPNALDSVAVPIDVEWPTEAIVDGRKLMKGVVWALAIEGVTALILFCTWYAYRLWR